MANNRGIKGGQIRTANDPTTPAPLFNFYPYQTGETYHNDPTRVDFVTHDGNLYVCTDAEKYASEPTPERNGGFLLIVKKGEDGQQGLMGRPGADGSTPEIKVRFEGKQLVIYDAVTQTRLASSPELVGPTWKPIEKDNKITWKLEEGTPASIDLDKLRPKEEHPVLFRLNSDNTKRSDEETGPGYYIQWKREGNEEWTDLMSISELMNIALAGVTFWMADDEHGATDSNGQPIQRLHVGHKQVVRATYDASKLGNRRIADVELGEVLFDAGEIPFPDFTEDINALNTFLCDLQGDLEVLRELIPLDYVKTVNGHLPVNGDVQLTEYYDKETSDGRYLRSVKQLNGQSLAGTGGLWIKTVNNQPLLTNDPAGGNVNVVGSIQIGNGTPITPDPDGIAHLPAYSGSDSTDGLTREEADGLYQPKGNYLKGVKVNGTTYNNPNSSGIVDLGNIGNGSGSDGVGVDNIEFRLSDNSLEYHVSINGAWQPWTPINLPSGSTGGGEHIELSIEDGILYISRNGGEPEPVGPVGNASGNWVKDIAKSGNTLVVTYWNGTSNTINIPSGGSGSTVSIRQVLLNGTHIATITVDGVAYDIFAPTGSSNPDDPSNPGGNGEDGIALDLTNEVNTIPVDKDKKTLSTASFLTELHAYSGGRTEIGFDQDDVTISVSPNITGINVVKNIDNNPKKFQINVNSGITVNEEVKIAFTLWANDSSRVARTAVYTLVPLRLSQSEMFYLELDPDIIKVDSEGNYTSETVSALPHWLLDGDPQSIVGWNDSSKINDATVKYHVYYKIDNGNYTFYTSPVDITSASNQAVFELRYYYNNNKTDYIVMDGPEHVLILRDGQLGPDGIRIINQNRYYKASDQSTGVTAPNENLDPTLPENGGWLTTSNSMQLDENHPYLWFFERFEYSDGSKWQSSPVIIRYFNAAAQADYEEIERNVLEAIDGDIDALNERLSVIVDTDGEIITDKDHGIIKALTSYKDEDQTSFADMILNAEEATVKTWAGSAFEEGTGRTLTGVKNELDGIQGRITTAATQARTDAVNDARTEWSAADASITSTATKAQYVWMASDGSLLEYTADDATNNRTTKSSGGKTYSRTLVSDAMSAIKQTADKVSILVGTNGNVKADVIVDAINGGTVTIDANKINLNGETIARTIEASQVDIKNDQSESTVILSKNGIDVRAGSLGGGNGVSITSNGVTLGSNCTISWNSVSDKPTIPSGDGADLEDVADAIKNGTLRDSNNNLVTVITESSLNTHQINADNITTGTLDASDVTITNLTVENLKVGGEPVGPGNSLNIVFGNSSTISNPQPNTIYFIYNT